MTVEGWTNDRLVAHRLKRLPRSEWIFAQPNASVVMAAFLHGAPDGARFSGPALGAWYAGLAERTAIKEMAQHLRREAMRAGLPEPTGQYRACRADLEGRHVDLRGRQADIPEVYRPDHHRASQAFAETVRARGGDGIAHDSVRDPGGGNAVVFRPTLVQAVTQSHHYALTVPAAGRILARHLT